MKFCPKGKNLGKISDSDYFSFPSFFIKKFGRSFFVENQWSPIPSLGKNYIHFLRAKTTKLGNLECLNPKNFWTIQKNLSIFSELDWTTQNFANLQKKKFSHNQIFFLKKFRMFILCLGFLVQNPNFKKKKRLKNHEEILIILFWRKIFSRWWTPCSSEIFAFSDKIFKIVNPLDYYTFQRKLFFLSH